MVQEGAYESGLFASHRSVVFISFSTWSRDALGFPVSFVVYQLRQ